MGDDTSQMTDCDRTGTASHFLSSIDGGLDTYCRTFPGVVHIPALGTLLQL
jgi:hypothetical protein